MICCLVGIFLLSLVTVTLLLYVTMDNEQDKKAFHHIELQYTKETKNNFLTNYFNHFIRYKMNRIRKPQYVDDQIKKYFFLKNRLQIAHRKDYTRVLASLKERLTIPQFCSNVKDIWECFSEDCIDDINEIILKLYPISAYFTENVYRYTNTTKTAKLNSFKMVNLLRFIDLCGSPFELSSINEFKGETIVSEKEYEMCLKEFLILMKDKKGDQNFVTKRTKGVTQRHFTMNDLDAEESERDDEEDDFRDYENEEDNFSQRD